MPGLKSVYHNNGISAYTCICKSGDERVYYSYPKRGELLLLNYTWRYTYSVHVLHIRGNRDNHSISRSNNQNFQVRPQVWLFNRRWRSISSTGRSMSPAQRKQHDSLLRCRRLHLREMWMRQMVQWKILRVHFLWRGVSSNSHNGLRVWTQIPGSQRPLKTSYFSFFLTTARFQRLIVAGHFSSRNLKYSDRRDNAA